MDTTMTWLIGIIITVGIAVFIRYFPKQSLMNKTGIVARKLGNTVSLFGNSKIGKKSMDKVEEGIIATIISVAMNFLIEFGKGLNDDK